MHEAADQDALTLLRQCDARGFDLAYARYAERIFAFLWRLSGSRALAEDLFQHTFMRLAEVGPRLAFDSDLRAWLFAIARNAFYSHSRARAVVVRADAALIPAPSGVPDPDAGLVLDGLERALATLAPSDRELLLLLGVEGLSPLEVAVVLQLDQATVRKRVSRARARLAEALDDQARVMPKSMVRE